MKISYGITVCDEHKELDILLKTLLGYIEENDEIIILCDISKSNSEVIQVIEKYKLLYDTRIITLKTPLNNDFATFKNQLIEQASGDYLFQIDADEVPNIVLLLNIKKILELNPDIDCYLVPRINVVENITPEHISKWRWDIDDKGRINFPDPQMRIFSLNKNIKWINKVHEILNGYSTSTILPYDTDYFCLYHTKSIEKQEKQNNFYETL